MRQLLVSLLWVLMSAPGFSESRHEPAFGTGLLLRYPPIAATANIAGDVRAAFRVEPNGDVSSVEILSGPPLLRLATEQNIRTWKLSTLEAGETSVKLETTVTYKLAKGCARTSIEEETFTVTVRSFHHMEIAALPPCVQTNQKPGETLKGKKGPNENRPLF